MKKHFIADLHSAIQRIEHKIVSRAVVSGHVVYYLLVSVEAHGYYRYAAAFLLVGVVWEVLHGRGPPA